MERCVAGLAKGTRPEGPPPPGDQGLVALAAKFPAIMDVRGRGLMVAMEFGGRDGGLLGESGTAAKVVSSARDRGLLMLTAGKRAPSELPCSHDAIPRPCAALPCQRRQRKSEGLSSSPAVLCGRMTGSVIRWITW